MTLCPFCTKEYVYPSDLQMCIRGHLVSRNDYMISFTISELVAALQERIPISKVKSKIEELEKINQSGDFDEHIQMLEELLD